MSLHSFATSAVISDLVSTERDRAILGQSIWKQLANQDDPDKLKLPIILRVNQQDYCCWASCSDDSKDAKAIRLPQTWTSHFGHLSGLDILPLAIVELLHVVIGVESNQIRDLEVPRLSQLLTAEQTLFGPEGNTLCTIDGYLLSLTTQMCSPQLYGYVGPSTQITMLDAPPENEQTVKSQSEISSSIFSSILVDVARSHDTIHKAYVSFAYAKVNSLHAGMNMQLQKADTMSWYDIDIDIKRDQADDLCISQATAENLGISALVDTAIPWQHGQEASSVTSICLQHTSPILPSISSDQIAVAIREHLNRCPLLHLGDLLPISFNLNTDAHWSQKVILPYKDPDATVLNVAVTDLMDQNHQSILCGRVGHQTQFEINVHTSTTPDTKRSNWASVKWQPFLSACIAARDGTDHYTKENSIIGLHLKDEPSQIQIILNMLAGANVSIICYSGLDNMTRSYVEAKCELQDKIKKCAGESRLLLIHDAEEWMITLDEQQVVIFKHFLLHELMNTRIKTIIVVQNPSSDPFSDMIDTLHTIQACSSGDTPGQVSQAQINVSEISEGLGDHRILSQILEDRSGEDQVEWDDVGGLESAKKDILDTIALPVRYDHLFGSASKFRSGLLLWGPPGTGKTMLAKAVASSCDLKFISVKGPELLNMYVGESEGNVRRLFARARKNAPALIFMDELDSLAPKRGQQGDSGGVMDRMVSSLLAELDGCMIESDSANQVYVIGATNRPDLLDPALLRPGRLDKSIYLDLPSNNAEKQRLLEAVCKRLPLAPDVDLGLLSVAVDQRLSGADYRAISVAASMKAIKREIKARETSHCCKRPSIEHADLMQALQEATPSVSEAEIRRFQDLRSLFERRASDVNVLESHMESDRFG